MITKKIIKDKCKKCGHNKKVFYVLKLKTKCTRCKDIYKFTKKEMQQTKRELKESGFL